MRGHAASDATTNATTKARERIRSLGTSKNFNYEDAARRATYIGDAHLSGPEGDVTAKANPNGSLENIAGVLNEGRNVLGMMPHPDRSSEALLGSADGLLLFQAMAESLAAAQ